MKKYKSKFEESSSYKEIKIVCKDTEDELENLIEYIRKIGNMGHSFDIVVDPDTSDYKRNFGWDGDGADTIKYVIINRNLSQDEYE